MMRTSRFVSLIALSLLAAPAFADNNTTELTQTGFNNIDVSISSGSNNNINTLQQGANQATYVVNNGYNNKFKTQQLGTNNFIAINTGRVAPNLTPSISNLQPTDFSYSAYPQISKALGMGTIPTQGVDASGNVTGPGEANATVDVAQYGSNNYAFIAATKGESNNVKLQQKDGAEAYLTVDGGQANAINVNQQTLINGPTDGNTRDVAAYVAAGGVVPAGYGPKAGVNILEGHKNAVNIQQLGNAQSYTYIQGANNTVSQVQTNGDYPWSFNGQGKTNVNPQYAEVKILGDNNSAIVNQNGGYGNTQVVNIQGTSDKYTGNQWGYGNTITASITGIGDELVLSQNGIGGPFTPGVGNVINATVTGNGNKGTLTQSGTNNTASIALH